MLSKFLLLLGATGVGKSTLKSDLFRLDERFIYISPFMTRTARVGETDKISITDAEMDAMADRGEFLVINQLYGFRYATPRLPIVKALNTGLFPVLEWPIQRLHIMRSIFPNRLFVVYVCPPSTEELITRLKTDGRDKQGNRITEALQELNALNAGELDSLYDVKIISQTNQRLETAELLYKYYLTSLK